MNTQTIKIGITMGDPSGIGPEIVARAIAQKVITKLGQVIIIGDRWVYDRMIKDLLKTKGFCCRDFNKRLTESVRFIDLNNVSHKNFRFGKEKGSLGHAAIEYLKEAVRLIRSKQIDCLVTAPISKAAINKAGYKYSGHTEFLAKAFNKQKQDLVMMLLNRYIKISLVTRHLAINKISTCLTKGLIYKNIIITYESLVKYFAIKHPVICVAALNPHAGEAGLLGKEEIEKIVPAIKKARHLIKDIIGPLPVDTAISAAGRAGFSAVVAMYHDQALIPLKTLDFNSGVNLTLGFDFVRTSPLHGTGFDIAGKNIASCASLVAAIKTAVECTKNLNKVKRIN